VLPIPRGRLSFSALVVGAMAPDFLYFIQLSHSSRYGHTLPGIFFFSLPAGLVVLWIFHFLFKRPMLALAPDHLARRISWEDLQYSFWPASRFAWVAISVLIGIFTHVLWDDFTHESGLFVTMAPELKLYFGLNMPLYSLLQLGSTLVGAIFLAWAYWRWVRRAIPRERAIVPQLGLTARCLILFLCLVVMMSFALPYGAQIAKLYPPANWWSVFIVKSVIASITAGFVEIFAFSLLWHLRKQKAPELELEG
jgi:hypothetical protein